MTARDRGGVAVCRRRVIFYARIRSCRYVVIAVQKDATLARSLVHGAVWFPGRTDRIDFSIDTHGAPWDLDKISEANDRRGDPHGRTERRL